MPKERFDQSNPHVNIGSIGSTAMSDISSITIAKEDLYKMFTKEQYRDYLLEQQSKLNEKDERIKELEKDICDTATIEALRYRGEIQKLAAALELVDDHAESCAIFVYNGSGCTCFYEKINEIKGKLLN